MMGPTLNSIKCCIIPLSSSSMDLESWSKATDFGSSCEVLEADCF